MEEKTRRREASALEVKASTEDSPVAPRLQAHSAALRSRDTARCITATGHSIQTQDVGYELERLAGGMAGLAAIVARTAGQGR